MHLASANCSGAALHNGRFWVFFYTQRVIKAFLENMEKRGTEETMGNLDLPELRYKCNCQITER